MRISRALLFFLLVSGLPENSNELRQPKHQKAKELLSPEIPRLETLVPWRKGQRIGTGCGLGQLVVGEILTDDQLRVVRRRPGSRRSFRGGWARLARDRDAQESRRLSRQS